MATIRNYGAALGGSLKQTAGGIVKGFGYGLKGAMLSEMPGLVAGYGAFSSLRKDANSMGQAKQAMTQPTTSQAKPSATGNPFAQMVQQLAQINSNTAMAASVAKASAQAEQYKRMFEEERAREQAQQNQALIDAIKKSGMGGGGGGAGSGAAEPPKKNFLESFLGGAAGAVGKMLLDGLVKGLSKLRTIIVAAFTAAMPFLRKMLTKVLSFALKRALFLIPGIGLLLGGAALAYDLADMGGAFDGDKGDDAGSKKSPSRGGAKKDSAKKSSAAAGPDPYAPSSPEDQGVSDEVRANSPVGKPTTTGANKTSALKWRVPLRNSYTVTSEHEEKRGPPKYKTSYTHKGVDLALYQGAPVVAAADGMITVNSSDARSGNYVMMDHGNGYTTFYAHLLMSNAMPGTSRVQAGTVIGYVGSSGHSSGPHLHFEIRLNGVSKNPRDFIQLGKKAQLTKVDREAEIPKPGAADAGEVDGAKVSNLRSKRVSITPASSSTSNLIEMGDGRVAEAYAGAGVNSPSQMTSAQVDAEIRRASNQKYFKQKDQDANTQRVLKELGGIKENTRITAKELKSNRITMSKGKFTRPEDILARANKQFTDSLQRQLTKTISGTLMSALYPGGYKNVSQKTASGQMYRGEQLNKMLGLTPALTKLGTSIFGKQYGPAFGQIFSKAATGYMEVGARSVAQGIFGSMGMNSDQANILGGQILGNLAKGTKQGKLTALEQILYGVSGGEVALGPETIFAKYGFATPAEGIGYMANVLGSAAMSPINSAMGTTPLDMRNMDPRMRTMGAFGGYGGEYGGMPSVGTQNATLKNDPNLQLNKDGMVTITDNMPAQTKTLAEQLNLAKQAEIDAKQRFFLAENNSQEQHIATTMLNEAQYEQAILTNRILSTRGSGGSGTNISIGGKGGDGGFFGGGGPLAEIGNMALDFGKSAITQKVVQSLGIKNPYMNMLASFAVNKGLSYAGNAIFGGGGGAGASFAAETGGKALSYLGDAFGSTSLATAGTALQYGTAVGSQQTAMLAAQEAGMFASTAGTTAAGGTLSSTLMTAAPYIFAAIVIFSLFKKKKRQPDPAVWRIIRVKDNNNIDSIIDLQAPRENPPKEFNGLADSLIRVGFNATKSAEVSTKKPTPFDFIVCHINNNQVLFSLRTGNPDGAGNDIDLGKPDKTFSAGKAASQIVKHITNAFKAAYAAEATSLDKVTADLNKKTFNQLSTGLTKELKTGKGKIDTTINKGVFGDTSAEDAILMAGRANKPQAATSGDDYNAGTTPMVYSMKEGKYVEAPSTMVDQKVTDDYGIESTIKVKQYTPNVLMLDKDGNPIYDKNNSGGIDLADIVKPTLTTTSATLTSGATAATSTTGTGTTGAVTVNTVADNSQKNNQSVNTYYASTLSKTKNPIKDAMLQTGMPG